MSSAGEVVEWIRCQRQFSLSEMAGVCDVSRSVLCRIRAEQRDPSWSLLSSIITGCGYRVGDLPLVESGSDERIGWLLRRYLAADKSGRAGLLGLFDSVAQVCGTVYRQGSALFEMPLVQVPDGRAGWLYGDLPAVLDALETEGQEPVLSGSEAMSRSTTLTSFTPMIYVNDPSRVTSFVRGRKGAFKTMRLMTATENVREFSFSSDGARFVRDEWALIDRLATPDRTSDAALPELDYWLEMERAA